MSRSTTINLKFKYWAQLDDGKNLVEIIFENINSFKIAKLKMFGF